MCVLRRVGMICSTKLRANIYKILDKILETGEPVEIERRGRILKIIPAPEKKPVSEKLVRRKGVLSGSPDRIIHLDWSSEWKP